MAKLTMNGTTNNSEWQRVTANHSERQQMTISDGEWQQKRRSYSKIVTAKKWLFLKKEVP